MTGSVPHLAAGLLAAAHGEPSKVPFYVAGGLFAVWAVVLSTIGLRRADFPTSGPVARAVMGLSLLLMLATTSMAVVTAGTPAKEAKAESGAAAPAAGAPTTTLQLASDPSGQLLFDRKTLAAHPGGVAIVFSNPSDVPHNVTIERAGKKVAASQTITKSKATVKVSLAPGEYTFYCSVDAHRQAGMAGKLTVQ
ncbi:MAG: hypothetical protein QOI98_2253 [Solirubrobacteraceae bacterium]|nr:hypothetical protein [Solirubrobacteraceae bacterium]